MIISPSGGRPAHGLREKENARPDR